MNMLSNVKSIRVVNRLRPSLSFSSTCVSLISLSRRNFAEGEQITRPKDGKYQNVFNKRKSRCGRFTYYSTFPYDYNEPWPFPPVYDKYGGDLNQDPMWGQFGQAVSSSITGKPKRALGHYPWIGRPIVPLDDSYRYIYDDQVAPFPFFRIGDYAHNRVFWWQWIFFFSILFGSFWFLDHYWRKNVSMTYYRDKLFFKEQLANDKVAAFPLGVTMYGNPASPIALARATKDRWCIGNQFIEYRFDSVFIPAAKEDAFADLNPHRFDFKYWPKKKTYANDPH
eukprot:837358_1